MSNPSPVVVRSIIKQHEPKLLEFMDAAKEKFNARLVSLTVPKTGLTLGDQSKYGASGVAEHYVPWIPNTDTVAEAKEWARLKAEGRATEAERARVSTRGRVKATRNR